MDYVPISWHEGLDILAVATVLGALLIWLRRSRARLALLGIAIAAVLYLLAALAGLTLTAWVFQAFFAVLVVVLVVVFQEDLRRLFESLAVWGLGRKRPPPPAHVHDVLVRAVARMAEACTGALIILPGREPLDRHLEGGIAVDGRLSEPLLLSIFDASSPGHDGAVLVEEERIQRFAVHLPLSTNQAALGPGGTRHAAGLGLAERCDALCIVVSEERGTVSVARDGRLQVLRQAQELGPLLQAFAEESAARGLARPARWRGLFRHWQEVGAAIALAGALWLVRVPGSTEGTLVQEVTVAVERLPEGYELESVEPPTVHVTLQGLRRDLFWQARREQAEVRIDALLAKLGRRTFQVGPDEVRAPPGLRVLEVKPESVKISLVQNGSTQGARR